jgi:sec-independent protein translocase protein TatB
MFDIGATELLVIAIVAILVIGPNDMPLALRTAGRWIGKVRRVSSHFRTGVEAMIRDAELEEMEKNWRDQNLRIMSKSGTDIQASGSPDKNKVSPEKPAGPGAPRSVPDDPPPLPAPGSAEVERPASGAARASSDGANAGRPSGETRPEEAAHPSNTGSDSA